ncbi:MAG: hypothetical protein SAL70_20635 [Scytonema sp. PMC 1070.18]|nr:hypothetical protein [Scytonema sp. PMC 1070.18]
MVRLTGVLFAIILVAATMTISAFGQGSPAIKISLERLNPNYKVAKLEFHNVQHTRNSYEVRVFLNQPDANADTPTEDNAHYAGSLYFYGQGDEYSLDGQKIPNRGLVAQEFDLSPGASNTSPMKLFVDITDSLRQLNNPSEIIVSLVAVDAQGKPMSNPDLHFSSVSVVTN